ncbi:MAG: discoidin domain-containing protein [Flammeovirgaceae bacterium]|nr:discoidin domain-containing protein [Flammeovirgaceae bacterium]
MDFNLPEDNPIYHAAWKHLTDTSHLLGRYGFRTNEPTYEYYFKQFTFHEGKRGSQWNGPSWPYQTSQAITGMANFINSYDQDILTSTDYLKSLRLFTRQHYLPDGKINLVENYDPNLGGPIVYFYWSNHYLHSSYNNLVITGLCGIRPSESDTLTINPLIDNSIDYFYLGDVSYHGHQVTIVYDKDGKKYKMGKGISVLVDGKKAKLEKKEGKIQVYIGEPIVNKVSESKENYALNISKNAFPKLSASVNSQQDSLLQIIDGKIWYFPEITNRWTTFGSQKNADWLEIDFGKVHEISMLKIYPFTDHVTFEIPENLIVEFQTNGEWKPVQNQTGKLIGNTANSFQFDKVSSTRFRISFKHSSKQVAFSEIEFY